MPRTSRAIRGGEFYHVLNRGNGKSQVFFDEDDYASFERLIEESVERFGIRILGYCLMPNHFHFIVWPENDEDVPRWMQWLMTSHVARHRKKYDTVGHIWQGRYKAFPIQGDEHLLRVMRYVERNALSSRLVKKAEEWKWSSLYWYKRKPESPILHPLPLRRWRSWINKVNSPLTEKESSRIKDALQQEKPFGDDSWVHRTIRRFNLEYSARPIGRPPKGDSTPWKN